MIARTAAEQARGLQGYAGLGPSDGMLFPFRPARAAQFHMGTVSFPIDLVFIDAGGHVARVVHAAQPGSRERWGHPICSAVVELQGGACAHAGIAPGDRLRVQASRREATSYNLLRTLVEADAPLVDGYYSQEPLSPGGVDTPRVPWSETRFEDRKLVDEAWPEARDQPMDGFKQQIGYQPTDALEEAGVGPNVRMSQRIEDPGALVASVVEAMARQQADGQAPLAWRADVLNAGTTETAVVTPADVWHWMGALGLGTEGRDSVTQAITAPDGLQVLGDGLVLAGLADQAKLHSGATTNGTVLVLHRGRR